MYILSFLYMCVHIVFFVYLCIYCLFCICVYILSSLSIYYYYCNKSPTVKNIYIYIEIGRILVCSEVLVQQLLTLLFKT